MVGDDGTKSGKSLKFYDSKSSHSAVGRWAKGKTGAPPKRKPPGVCKSTDPSVVWYCEVCDTNITNNSACVSQHKGTNDHRTAVSKWEAQGKALANFICKACKCTMDNDANVVRAHFRSKCHPPAASASSPVAGQPPTGGAALPTVAPVAVQQQSEGGRPQHHCQLCNLHMDNTPDVVNAHNTSHAHQSQRMYMRDNDSRPDGARLAAATQDANTNMKWITIIKKDGVIINKLVKCKANASAALPAAFNAVAAAPAAPSSAGASPVAAADSDDELLMGDMGVHVMYIVIVLIPVAGSRARAHPLDAAIAGVDM